jgi:hypothetical protein|tara:strand:- start:1204 stop:1464 length:261 start_codon:yes stop_codon:yes gene_type:complete
MREKILELYGDHTDEGLLFADGLDEAIIGICPNTLRLVYSRTKVINVFIKDDDMDEIDAIEYAEYNTFNAYVGEQTPIFIDDFDYD